MKTIFILFALMASSFSFAQSDIATETRYQTILSWYNQGRDVKWTEVKGSYSGRCYWMNKQNDPDPKILTYVLPQENDGPGFPNLPLAFFIMNWKTARFPQDYDNISLKDLAGMQDDLRRNYMQTFVDFSEVPTVMQLVDFEPNKRTDLKAEYRKFQEFIILRMTNLIPQNYANPDSFFAKAGDILMSCYFFKQVGE